MERLDLEFKFAPSDAGVINGLASPFGGAPDRVRDIVAPGAFARSLAEHKARGTMPAMQLSHDPAAVAGTWETMEEAPEGLKVSGRLALGTTTGDEAYAFAKTKAVTGLSIGFRTVKATRLPGGVRRLDEVDLLEVSLVAVPAAPSARITSVKSFPAAGAAILEESTMEDETTAAPDNGTVETKAAELVAGIETKMTAAITAALAPITDRLGKVETALRRPGAAPTTETKGAEAPERKAFENYLRGGTAGMDYTEVKTLRTGDDTSAGYLAPAEFIAEVDKNIVLWSPVRQFATVRNTTRGSVELPKRIGRPTATWVEELEDREDTETGSRYGKSAYEVKELTAYVDVAFSTLEDAAVDIFAELAGDLAEEFGQAEGQAFVSGNGVKRPMGFMSDTTIPSVVTGDAAKILPDSLIDLFHALPSPYRTNAVWGMNSTTLGACRKLKTTTGEYLLSMTGLAGSPVTTILGRPVVELPDMPDVAGGAIPIIFGDFAQGYRVFDRVGFYLLRDDLTQRTKGKCRFHARKRVAGGVRKSEALRKLIVAAS
ncbi:HK97 family phage major capsid protein/HK97 family phage prohead protease [Azospirillum fermentarium]|uniref:phage major capsid protein n=1 Tax=Azospirillum fermentarium TaxID=1233114 RepID=UPI00222726A0|nr:phage major capsid protein [Azospirillum fermentarium]MCW2246211.1 HK97 family phage major capsid protein/HK97 family phage prohead protease [Azospirillum fermentarium]